MVSSFHFLLYFQWAESQNTMQRQRLLDALTNPMQRLTRYSLLLKAVLKNTIEDEQRGIIQVSKINKLT